MRIRTIKPEFWGHPVLSRLDDSARLLAIGLLNVADDEGYFLAAPGLIRSAIWPLDEDSTKARRTLDHLSISGYVELREHATHGEIGFVTNFTKHQRVDRPSPSRLKTYFDSANARRILDERSLLDQGSGIREQVIAAPPSGGAVVDPELPLAAPIQQPEPKVTEATPLPFNSPAFVAAWAIWEKHCRERSKGLKPTARRLQLKKLAAMGEARAIAAIEHSAANNYQGIFEPNNNTTTTTHDSHSRRRVTDGQVYDKF